MKWIVGLDLRPSSQGALHYATWLREHNPSYELRAVHVVESGAAGEPEALSEPARAATERVLARTESRTQFSTVTVVAGKSPHVCLLEAAGKESADAMVVGREGAGSSGPADRLGEVSRRLLRALPCPIIVTRPDLHAKDVGAGPVIVATDLSPESAGALAFGARLAGGLGRELVVAHVRRHLEHPAIYEPGTDWNALAREQDEACQAAVADWISSHSVTARVIVDEGITTRRLMDMAHVEEACLVVCGARSHGEMHVSATGTDMAANARVPVAIVPPK